ncbi:inositol phospholipid synthesis and fat-storage-inducing TM-domain-containing protein [Coprinopsis sp. MPI-PUGE-AT-0042]|nr:inositol phospholipid synthesis and fat-storage-inducing TM-domain-containing protein [Coprinopsis sp. MPI-PUGE-AT-0042]
MNIQRPALVVLSAIILGGTAYSVFYDTYLDTSNPLLTHLAHPLAQSHYFADKKNWLNVLFIKKAWGWTSGAFILSWLTSPLKISSRPSARLLLTYLTLTGMWVLFTSWFFGPALLERVILLSGGECVLPGPGNVPVTVPPEYCFTKSTISFETHPQLFQSLFSQGIASSSSSTLTPQIACPPSQPDCHLNISGVPRLRKGHDVSGHLFLLSMGVMLLARQLEASVMAGMNKWSVPHTISVVLNIALLALWLLASATTSVYFHLPSEKVTGFVAGVVGYAISQFIVSVVLPREKAEGRVLKTQ